MTYGMSHEYMTFSNLYIVCRVNTHSKKQRFVPKSYIYVILLKNIPKSKVRFFECMTLSKSIVVVTLHPPGGMIFDKHDKSRRYLTLMTVEWQKRRSSSFSGIGSKTKYYTTAMTP